MHAWMDDGRCAWLSAVLEKYDEIQRGISPLRLGRERRSGNGGRHGGSVIWEADWCRADAAYVCVWAGHWLARLAMLAMLATGHLARWLLAPGGGCAGSHPAGPSPGNFQLRSTPHTATKPALTLTDQILVQHAARTIGKLYASASLILPPPPHHRSPDTMASKRPFQILALPLVRIPHGPLKSAAAAAASKAGPSTAAAPPATADGKVSQVSEPDDAKKEAPLTLYLTQQPNIGVNDEKPPIYQQALDKAVEQWDKLGEKPKGSWMRYFHTKGESLMDKIEYEEWALKNVKEGQGVKFDKDGVPDKKIKVSTSARGTLGLGVGAPGALDPSASGSSLRSQLADIRSPSTARPSRASACPRCCRSCTARSCTGSRTTRR